MILYYDHGTLVLASVKALQYLSASRHLHTLLLQKGRVLLQRRPGAGYYTTLYKTILYYTILYYTILYYTILYYTILHYTVLTILYSTILD